MGNNEFQHVRSGEPIVIPAATYNAMLDAAQAHRNRNMNISQQGTGFDSLFVHVENATQRYLERFDIVGLDGPSETQNLDNFCNHIAFKGVVPRKEHAQCFAVIQQDAAPGMMVRACVSGVTIGKINVEKPPKDMVGLSCSAGEGITGNLELGGGGAAVLWVDSGSGIKWAIIHLGANTLTIHTGKVSKEIKPGVDPENDEHGGTVDEENGGEAGQRAFAGMLEKDEKIKTGIRVEWLKVGGVNRIINAKCEAKEEGK